MNSTTTPCDNKNAIQTKLRVLDKIYTHTNTGYTLNITYVARELCGFDNRGNQTYRNKIKSQVFYGMTKHECNDKMKGFCVQECYVYKKHNLEGALIYAEHY